MSGVTEQLQCPEHATATRFGRSEIHDISSGSLWSDGGFLSRADPSNRFVTKLAGILQM